jgi:hypothetical protein
VQTMGGPGRVTGPASFPPPGWGKNTPDSHYPASTPRGPLLETRDRLIFTMATMMSLGLLAALPIDLGDASASRYAHSVQPVSFSAWA